MNKDQIKGLTKEAVGEVKEGDPIRIVHAA